MTDPGPGDFDFSRELARATDTRSLYASSHLDLYQRIIQYFGITIAAGGLPLDLVNFRSGLFPDVLCLNDVLDVFRVEHGYGAPDGESEIGTLLVRWVRERTRRYLALGESDTFWLDHEPLAAGIGTGTTGVVGCLLQAIRQIRLKLGQSASRILLATPQYSVYDGIARSQGLEVQHVSADATAKFLPSQEQIARALESQPMALLLAYPTNPAQTTYQGDTLNALRGIIRACQDAGTFLVVDNIYEDALWSDSSNPEVFAFTDHSTCIAKVSGPSKDRPSASGFRIGYYVGDRRLAEPYLYYASLHSNTPNSASRCWLALDLLLRRARALGRSLRAEDFELLGSAVAGWNRPFDPHAAFERTVARGLEERYLHSLAAVETLQRSQQRTMRSAIESASVFDSVVNDDIGNLLLVRVNADAYPGDCHELFEYLMDRVGVGILPGNAFGFPRQRGDAWFRMTTIHEPVEELLRRIELVRAALESH